MKETGDETETLILIGLKAYVLNYYAFQLVKVKLVQICAPRAERIIADQSFKRFQGKSVAVKRICLGVDLRILSAVFKIEHEQNRIMVLCTTADGKEKRKKEILFRNSIRRGFVARIEHESAFDGVFAVASQILSANRFLEKIMAPKVSKSVPQENVIRILVYSDNRLTREEVINSVGYRVAAELPEIRYTEAATWEGAEIKVREEKFDLLILDAEASKLGGIGLGMKIRDEIDPDLPYIVLIARPQDDWLARVSKPRGIVSYPINPRELSAAVVKVLTGQE